jgi:hypothetical protein
MAVDWSRRFDVPVILPDGKRLASLADARQYLLTIPQADYTDAIGVAAEALVMAAEGHWPIMLANAGIARVVHGPRPIAGSKPSRRKRAKKYGIISDERS